jgi:hypothetical protein
VEGGTAPTPWYPLLMRDLAITLATVAVVAVPAYLLMSQG